MTVNHVPPGKHCRFESYLALLEALTPVGLREIHMSNFRDTSEVSRKAARTKYEAYIARWLVGKEDGMRGKTATSMHIKRWLIEKHQGKCAVCGWNEINPTTGRSPLAIEHIDGNFTNNIPENLILLCPNCHSLTPTYKSLNKGKGRPR